MKVREKLNAKLNIEWLDAIVKESFDLYLFDLTIQDMEDFADCLEATFQKTLRKLSTGEPLLSTPVTNSKGMFFRKYKLKCPVGFNHPNIDKYFTWYEEKPTQPTTMTIHGVSRLKPTTM